jgi:hypothetical protein
MAMRLDEIKVRIEGYKPLWFDRFHDRESALNGTMATQGPSRLWSKEQFYTTDNELFKRGAKPAIPIQEWLVNAMYECGGKVKLQGKQTLKKWINSGVQVKEERVAIGSEKHLEHPEIVFKTYPKDKKSGTRHAKEYVGFNAGWVCEFTILYMPDKIPHAKVRELLEITGLLNGIGAYHERGGYGRFTVESFIVSNGRKKPCA